VDAWQIMWGIHTLLLGIVGFLIRLWILGVKESISEVHEELKKKTDKGLCEFTHGEIAKCAHSHATSGSAGEVIPR